jgi:hypothetical protein
MSSLIADSTMVHPSAAYEDYVVGDEVSCLAWLGTRFTVVGKDDAARSISLQGIGTSVPALIDIYEQNLFMLAHENLDQVWYWRDRAGETYDVVFDRFVAAHHDGEVVPGYFLPMPGLAALAPVPALELPVRLNFSSVVSKRQILGQIVVAVGPSRVVDTVDAGVSDDAWQDVGPAMPMQVEMTAYRWSLTFAGTVVNVVDFLPRA